MLFNYFENFFFVPFLDKLQFFWITSSYQFFLLWTGINYDLNNLLIWYLKLMLPLEMKIIIWTIWYIRLFATSLVDLPASHFDEQKNLLKLFDTFETCISNHHKFISTILKSVEFKEKPKEKIYRSYKQFNSKDFKKIWNLDWTINQQETAFLEELNRHLPVKKKILRHSNNRFMTKELRKAIMVLSKLKNMFNKDKNDYNWKNYKHLQSFCLNL